ncbi:hypothetical protein TPHA_0A05120 [Tetrapisispora phaffii CBS 4417]|uniref:nitric oxide dioxygenase n=1 Tax=Tetrapisispora phaffii (strain ATCC 24235 / CBS 4417 / NBRC 1672 / NRRL Y-8282 / UCD 70-5) TaxID=1071381 RepID=G8BNV9_TETPH|nr:hypothetical protein TPHA_0A05120 [Tetrapisispora phaffii CBS 4417]CCE61587.1 hypothetical protein TPHA_0A05120 [Tetrapisispora phaffii CBS 4417]
MLSEETRTIVKATIPVLEAQGAVITKHFYAKMLGSNEELLNIFNMVNQKKGAQPTALATTILAAAKHIDDLSPLIGHVKQIGHKHRALQIMPEHYPIVGKNLLLAIKDVLGDAATPEIISAWGEAYEEIANVFITVEADMYKEAAWESWKPFEVISKAEVGDGICEFTVKPTKESGVDLSTLKVIAGQYITVNTHPTRHDNKYDALRHYSICSNSTKDGLKFAVKLEHTPGKDIGLVSEFLHKDVKAGDNLLISAPAGDFQLNEKLIKQNETPLVLLAAGVGVTPLLSMLETQVNENPSRPVYWIQSSRDETKQAFKNHVDELLTKTNTAEKLIVHTKDQARIDAEYLKKNVPKNSDVYICGSVDFMKSMIGYLKNIEHDEAFIHYEPFGPKMSTIQV